MHVFHIAGVTAFQQCSVESSPYSVFGRVARVLGRGQAEVTQVVLLSVHHQSGDPDQMQIAS